MHVRKISRCEVLFEYVLPYIYHVYWGLIAHVVMLAFTVFTRCVQ